MWPSGSRQIHTSSQAGGIASRSMRSSASGSSIRSPPGSRYSNPRPRRRRLIPGRRPGNRFALRRGRVGKGRTQPKGRESMGILDKITGRAKKAAGDVADDPSLRREGRQEERKGEAKDELARADERAEEKADE